MLVCVWIAGTGSPVHLPYVPLATHLASVSARPLLQRTSGKLPGRSFDSPCWVCRTGRYEAHIWCVGMTGKGEEAAAWGSGRLTTGMPRAVASVIWRSGRAASWHGAPALASHKICVVASWLRLNCREFGAVQRAVGRFACGLTAGRTVFATRGGVRLALYWPRARCAAAAIELGRRRCIGRI